MVGVQTDVVDQNAVEVPFEQFGRSGLTGDLGSKIGGDRSGDGAVAQKLRRFSGSGASTSASMNSWTWFMDVAEPRAD